ncbi:MAG: hypothetical protein EOP84_06955 [Verrucomicrobiaceae bacterium]|nr:MAG: hypothetical protein EOP84_06955 [Verrucomicrobiaceae bacterium]
MVRYSQAFLVSWLRARLRLHNRQVINFTGLSVAGTIVGWGGLYALAHWVSLLFAAIIRGPYAALPAEFPLGFAAIACALIFSAWVDRKLTTNDLPPDTKAFDEVAMDFLLAIPRMTLAVPANLSAWVRLSKSDQSQRLRYLQR